MNTKGLVIHCGVCCDQFAISNISPNPSLQMGVLFLFCPSFLSTGIHMESAC